MRSIPGKRERKVGVGTITASTPGRQRLPNRRASTSFNFDCNGLAYSATVSRYANGDLAEIFIGNAKAGSHSDSAAKDSAVVCSLALKHGIPSAQFERHF